MLIWNVIHEHTKNNKGLDKCGRKKERKKEWKRKKIKIRVKERKEKREIAC